MNISPRETNEMSFLSLQYCNFKPGSHDEIAVSYSDQSAPEPRTSRVQAIVNTVSALTTNFWCREEDIPPKVNDSTLASTIYHLRYKRGFRLSSKHIKFFIDFLEKQSDGKLKVFHEGYLLSHLPPGDRKPSTIIYKHASDLADLMAIPFVFQDHIVLILIDRCKRQIEYYDSQAVPLKTRTDTNPKFNLEKNLFRLADDLFENYAILKSSIPHQSDVHSCGVYICNFLERRCNGESFEAITNNGLPFHEVQDYREKMARKLTLLPLEKVCDAVSCIFILDEDL